ncbi:Cobalt-zinc-cadmium resistance protein [Marinobacter nitratireducens]|uniref:Cobalt-zinc-cadmium resistance protein n=1 Tax=Marinobacter nitratireducens TaxID=1137280 RepID=A0A072N1A8_9GAMM|nr:cation diffusion facilitator family transporter [Marinobacter nitratireducens]KEF31459.1 Cobalt-zinc-cadmium resistance protein [Marinobacter nitratireducens]TNF00882.1 MAG: cation transporter [Gammaproteobacteria bacterium]
MQQVFNAQSHQHALREADKFKDCAPTDIVGSTPREGVQVTLLGMAIDIGLGGLKVVAGAMSGSHALIADGIHSFSDAMTDVLVIVMMRYSRQPADDDHPYGHERFETLGTVLMGCLLMLIAAGMVWDSLFTLLTDGSQIETGWLAIAAALISIAVKEWLFRYTKSVGEKIKSELIISNAWHSRTDAISSIVVLLAIVGAATGIEWLDLAAAIAVAFAIGKIGLGMMTDNIKELVDTALAPDKRSRLLTLVEGFADVKNVASLRSRRMGNHYLVDCSLVLPGTFTIAQSQQYIATITNQVLNTFPEIREFAVRVEADTPSTTRE